MLKSTVNFSQTEQKNRTNKNPFCGCLFQVGRIDGKIFTLSCRKKCHTAEGNFHTFHSFVVLLHLFSFSHKIK